MRKKRIGMWSLILAVMVSCLPLSSCGSLRSYWGVEGNYDFDDHYHHRHKPPKPPKPPKHGHKHDRHHHHHHDDD